MRPAVVLALAVAAAGLAACGSPDGASDRDDAELTPEGIAEVVGEHVDRRPTSVEAWDVMTRELDVESPGAALRFGDDFLAVAVTPSTENRFVCSDTSFFDECLTFSHGGGDLVLAWQELEPEEDPGVVYVVDVRDDEAVLAHYSGVGITGDPRDLDLGITVDQMADVVTDERLTLH